MLLKLLIRHILYSKIVPVMDNDADIDL